VYTMQLTLCGLASEPTEHDSFNALGDALATALDEAGLGLKPKALAFLLSLMFGGLRTNLTWRWVAADYEIYVSREGPNGQ